VGKDGRKAYERVKGKKYKGEMLEFGRKVFHRHAGNVQGGNMEKRWGEGIWLGKKVASNEHIIAMKTGEVIQARSVMLKTESESWDVEEVLGVSATPWSLNGNRQDGQEYGMTTGGRQPAEVMDDGQDLEAPRVAPNVRL